MIKRIASGIVLAMSMVGCAPASYHANEVQADNDHGLTVGVVQREVKVGMSSAQVAEILGSPNVVSTDEERREVWIYDKIATDVVSSESNGFLKFMTRGKAAAHSKSQRTLTVVIKFDEAHQVRDFAYHTSRF